MTWNGNGVVQPPGLPEFPAVVGDLIRASYFNTIIQALCDDFLNTVPRDGQAPLLGDLNFNGTFRPINLPAAMANGQAVRYQELQQLQVQVNNLSATAEPYLYLNSGIT